MTICSTKKKWRPLKKKKMRRQLSGTCLCEAQSRSRLADEFRARRATDPLVVAPPTNRRKDRPNRPNGLTKQTYSALVYLPGSSHPRKWHVVAYFTVSPMFFQ